MMMIKMKMITITVDVDNEMDAVFFHASYHLTLTRILGDRNFQCPLFTDEEPDKQSWGGSKCMKLRSGRVEI